MSAVAEDLARLRSASEAPSEVPLPLPSELLPVEPFPLIALPNAFRPWVSDVSERMQCPPEYAALPMITAASMLVARYRGISPQTQTDWRERANLWALKASESDMAFFLVHPNVGPELASAVRIGSGRPTGGFVRPNWIVSSVPWRLLVLGLYRSMSRDSRASVRAADNVRRIPGKSRWCC